jgi:UDP-N-acetylmuramoylalanine--D-glutamate ligase
MTRDELTAYKDRNVHIAGASSAEGYAVLGYLISQGFTHIAAHDLNIGDRLRQSFNLAHVSLARRTRDEAFQRLLSLPVEFRLGDDYLKDLDQAELVFAGQNWFSYPENKPIADVRARGIPVKFLIQLYFGLSRARIAAVTGTNGKTTVTSLLYHILESAGIPSLMSGNDRYHPQVLDRLESLPSNGVLVLEVSNRQLLELDRGPKVAILTNVTRDHIEEHGSFKKYAETKERLFQLQKEDGWAIINSDDPVGKEILSKVHSQPVPYSLLEGLEPGAGRMSGGFGIKLHGEEHLLFTDADLKIPGAHNQYNALAAAAGSFLLGVEPERIRSAMREFRGVRNRIQWLGEVNGVDYYDDLASTNPSATTAALNAFSRPVVLIAGGDAKGNAEEYSDLALSILQRAKAVILLDGSAGECIREAIGYKATILLAASLEEALSHAADMTIPGDIVLLSPSGAGFYSRFVANSIGFRKWLRDKQISSYE